LQRILGEPQVKVSKHLAYLRKRRLVECRRDGNWMIYRLPAKPSRELAANLACLQDCVAGSRTFRRDAARRSRLCAGSSAGGSLCCPPEGAGSPVGKREAP
jgi:ArsR family transcriptional regulator